jgi:hypothetical protein
MRDAFEGLLPVPEKLCLFRRKSSLFRANNLPVPTQILADVTLA